MNVATTINGSEREGMQDPSNVRRFLKNHVFKQEQHGSLRLCEIFNLTSKAELFELIDKLYPNGSEGTKTKKQIERNDKMKKKKEKETSSKAKSQEVTQVELQTESQEMAQNEPKTETQEVVKTESQKELQAESEVCVEELLEEIKQIESAIHLENVAISDCEKRLMTASEETTIIHQQAIKLQEQIAEYLQKIELLTDSCIKLQHDMEEHTAHKTSLCDKLEYLREEVQKKQALYYTLEESCVTERCKLASEEVSVSVPEVCEQIGCLLNPNNEEVSNDFRNCAQICSGQELMQIAEAYLYAAKLKELYPNRDLYWHFSCNTNVSEMMSYTGLVKIVIA